MSVEDEQPFSDIEATLKKSAAALREAGVPFLLGGSLASWARGGPETRHDLDLMIKREDVDRALQALVDAGMRAEDPPEEWLVKAWDGDVLVDLIFWPKGLPIDDEVIARGEELAVLSMTMRVMALEDVLITKLMADLGAPPALRGPDRDRPGAARADRLGARPRRDRLARPSPARSSCMVEGLGDRPARRRVRRESGASRGAEGPRRHRCRFSRRRRRVAATHGRTIDDARAAPPPR